VMGNTIYDLWVWLHVIATTVVMCGLYLEDRAKATNYTELRDPLGRTSIRLQTGGHACMFFVLLAYEVSAIDATYWGQGTYSIFVISPYVVGCLLLVAQGVVKIVTGQWDSQDGEL
jgi:hypothetical protein